MGELVKEPLENPIIKPSIEAMAETYELAVREPELASVTSPYTSEKLTLKKRKTLLKNYQASRKDNEYESYCLYKVR
jgi:aromatic ring hydroxylase